jgi:hypothetical protein
MPGPGFWTWLLFSIASIVLKAKKITDFVLCGQLYWS